MRMSVEQSGNDVSTLMALMLCSCNPCTLLSATLFLEDASNLRQHLVDTFLEYDDWPFMHMFSVCW